MIKAPKDTILTLIDSLHTLKWKIKEIPYRFKIARQRVARGWADADAYGGIEQTILKNLGEALVYLGEISHGSPFGYPTPPDVLDQKTFTDHEAWKSDLIKHGKALIDACAYSDSDLAHKDFMEDRDMFKEKKTAFDTGVREALLWVATWRESLWD